MSSKTAYISHDDCLLHDMGPHHPESPDRLRAIAERLRQGGLMQELQVLEAVPSEREPLLRIHPRRHLETLESAIPRKGFFALDADTQLCPDSGRAALLAAGAVVQAVDGVMAGEFRRAFCAVRPPGHHAERELPMGFCLYNNVAVGVRHAMEAHGISRAAVLDFDVHHGNGTVDIFKDDEAVLVCSTFQHPFYPNRHWDVRRSNIVNSPLSAGSDGDDFRRAVEHDWLPALERHRPELIFVSAGFDAHRADPLGGLELIEDDYRWVTELISQCARKYSNSRVVAVLEGGYDLEALAGSVEACLAAMAE